MFIGFITEPIKKDENIILEVNLMKGDELVKEEVTCTAIENVEPKDGEQLQVDFECKVEGIEKAEEYTGLELVESKDISGIPTNPDLLNPAKVDELIKEDKIKNYTSEDFKKEENVVFNCTSINTTDSEKTGVFILTGEILSKTDFKLEKSIEFEIILIGGEKALCTLPKITEKGEIKIECVIQEELVDSKIMIQQCSALDGYNEIFKLNKISSEEKVTLPNGKEIQLEKTFDINLSFGQLNGFGVEGGIISFMFIGFITEPIKKDEEITMVVELIIGGELVEEEAKCIAKENVDPKDDKQIKVDFECKVENIEKAEECTGLELVSSEDFTGIPEESSLLNPAVVDELIEAKEIQNYTSEDIEIPVLNCTSIDTTNSSKTGTFIIIGEFLSDFELQKSFEFEIILITGEKALCTLPKVSKKGEIEIECILQEKLEDSKIMIEQFSVLDGFNELIRLNKIASPEKVTIPSGKEIKLEEVFDISLSFGQMNGFAVEGTLISFMFIGFTTKPLKKDESITMVVDLIINGELVEEEAKCIAKENVDPKDDKQIKVDFECKVENIEKAEECTGLELVSSEDFTGIPEESSLLNPAVVDELIEAKEIQNYTSEDIEIPVLNCTSIDTTNSSKTGTFIIIGEFLSDFELQKSFEFEIILITGEKALCTLPKVSKKGEIEIECILQEKLEDSKIMIEQFSVLDGFNELIRLNKIASDKEVTIPSGKEIKLVKEFDISLSFGQVCDFKIEEKLISFFFAGLTSEPIKKDESITIIVDLIIGEDLVEEEAICISKEEVNPSNDKQLKADFECTIKDVEKAKDCTGLEIVSSEEISGIPTEEDLINPAKVDELIEAGEIVDFTLEENKDKIESIPTFNATSIDTSEALAKGIFCIIGKPLSEFILEKELVFEIILVSGEKAECTLPEVTSGQSEIKIECVLEEELKDTKIMIEQFTALDGYKEIIRMNKFATEKEITVANGKMKKLQKKFNSKLSFRQTNDFKFDPSSKSVTFVIAVFVTEPITKNEEIIIDTKVLLTIDSTKEEAICVAEKDITLSDSDTKLPVNLNCKIENIELEENIECIGLEIEESEILSNIPENPKLCNPKKVDKLIASGEIELAKEEITIPEFNATSIDTTGSMASGVFSIIGKPLDDIPKEFIFNITLITGQMASCSLPKSTKNNEVKIECELDGTIENEKIMIPETTVLFGFKEIFTFNKIQTKREVSCANGKLKKMNKKLENKISFRQMSHFKPSGKIVSFILSAFIIENMEKGKEISMDVNLDKGNEEFLTETATCKLNEAVSGASEDKQVASDFECSIENIEDAEKVIGLEVLKCDEVSGIPSEPNMTNPAEVDKLIESGEVLDYTLEVNKKSIPPSFKTASITSLGCRSSGVFKLKGKFDKKIEHFRFNLPLSYPLVDTRCDVPEANEGEDIEVICKTKSPFSSSKIIIEQSTITKNNSEAISLLPISSEEEVSCEDFKEVYTRKMEKLYRAPFSFRQVSNFKNDNGIIHFLLFVFKTEFYKGEKEITISINSILKSSLRHLDDDIIPLNVDCTATSTESNPISFDCPLKGSPLINNVVVTDSDELSGIPENDLANPSVVDDLIKNGTVKDCSKDDCSLPTFTGELSYSDCNSGIINIENGKIDGDIKDGSVFNLSISPESYGDCQISVNDKKIECYNKEEILDGKIIIPETVVRDKENSTDLFKLTGVVSDTDDISCAINDDMHASPTEPSDTPSNEISPNKTISDGHRYVRNKSSSGLSGGAIAGIIIGVIAAIIALISIIVIAKQRSNVKPPMENISINNNNNVISDSLGNFKSQV